MHIINGLGFAKIEKIRTLNIDLTGVPIFHLEITGAAGPMLSPILSTESGFTTRMKGKGERASPWLTASGDRKARWDRLLHQLHGVVQPSLSHNGNSYTKRFALYLISPDALLITGYTSKRQAGRQLALLYSESSYE